MGTPLTQGRTADAVLAEELQDPEFRAYWERTALGRAVALRLVRYRAEHGLTQGQLARRLDMKQPQIARLETGESSPKVETLVRLANELGVEFLIDVRPASRQPGWASPEARDAEVVEEVQTAGGGHLLVAAS
ncbi:MAG TPA: helix-turn-helix transcriptional regulator [Thermomicrobiaceae bacterium]|nr:helix-turn-helix transcriptional regulator [Thermomicrobiaceae bacterium]